MSRQQSDIALDNKELQPRLDQALQIWGRSATPNYSAFQPLVELELHIVENQARLNVTEEISRTGMPRNVSDSDRAKAVWMLIKLSIRALLPTDLCQINPAANAALQRLPDERWPARLRVPGELHEYLVLACSYIWKNYHIKELARLLGLSERVTFAYERDTCKSRT